MNPALILAHNNVDLTKRCVESLRNQDIPVTIFIVDGGSTDGTNRWMGLEENMDLRYLYFPDNIGFSRGVNEGMKWVFYSWDENGDSPEWCLVPNNDTVMPKYYYRTLLEQGFPVVSGVQHINGHRVTMEDLEMVPPIQPVRPNPDFSSILFRKTAWDALGGFDARMWNYCSDCDMHIRAWLKGIEMNHVHVPYFHVGSATVNNASPEERAKIQERQRPDWKVFHDKWGCDPGTPEYNAIFIPELFGVNP